MVYFCDYPTCEKKFKTATGLKLHRDSAHLNVTFTCNYGGCGKKFKQISSLNLHKRSVHEKIKPFECTYNGCGKRFNQKVTLQAHMNNVHLHLGKPRKTPGSGGGGGGRRGGAGSSNVNSGSTSSATVTVSAPTAANPTIAILQAQPGQNAFPTAVHPHHPHHHGHASDDLSQLIADGAIVRTGGQLAINGGNQMLLTTGHQATQINPLVVYNQSMDVRLKLTAARQELRSMRHMTVFMQSEMRKEIARANGKTQAFLKFPKIP